MKVEARKGRHEEAGYRCVNIELVYHPVCEFV